MIQPRQVFHPFPRDRIQDSLIWNPGSSKIALSIWIEDPGSVEMSGQTTHPLCHLHTCFGAVVDIQTTTVNFQTRPFSVFHFALLFLRPYKTTVSQWPIYGGELALPLEGKRWGWASGKLWQNFRIKSFAFQPPYAATTTTREFCQKLKSKDQPMCSFSQRMGILGTNPEQDLIPSSGDPISRGTESRGPNFWDGLGWGIP